MAKYTGIGSRQTPSDVLSLMENVAKSLAAKDWTLRTGGAPGADQAFWLGATSYYEYPWNVELFLPWDGFEGFNKENLFGKTKVYSYPSAAAFEIAEQYHPYWPGLTHGAKKLMARNVHQILGPDVNDPVDCVICWTQNAKLKGGTAQALRIASDLEIPIYNFGDDLTYKLFDGLKSS